MPNKVEFHEWKPERLNERKTPALIKLVMKTGLVKNEKQANYVLLGISITAIILMIYFFASAFGNKIDYDYEQMIRIDSTHPNYIGN
jgi:hypothetical protein